MTDAGRSAAAFAAPGAVVSSIAARWSWFCDHREPFGAQTRRLLMETMLVRTPSMVFATLAVMLLAGLCGVRTHGARWPLGWLVLDALLLCLRLRLIARAKAAPPGDERAFRWYTAVGTLWCALLGCGAWACIATGDSILVTLAGINVAGIAAGISSRTAAFPRLAVLQIVLVGTPYTLGAATSGVPDLLILAFQTPLSLAAMCSLTRTHHCDTVNLIRAERRNWFLAVHDTLTELPNRQLLHDRLSAACNALGPATDAVAFALLCLDLDGFKGVNDAYGHAAGDELLRAVAERLRNEVRAGDLVARIGGDEFVVLLPGADRAEAAQIADRIIAAIAQPYHLGYSAPLAVGTAVGAAFAPADGTNGQTLLLLADQALYRAKRAGGGRYNAGGDEVTRTSPATAAAVAIT